MSDSKKVSFAIAYAPLLGCANAYYFASVEQAHNARWTNPDDPLEQFGFWKISTFEITMDGDNPVVVSCSCTEKPVMWLNYLGPEVPKGAIGCCLPVHVNQKSAICCLPIGVPLAPFRLLPEDQIPHPGDRDRQTSALPVTYREAVYRAARARLIALCQKPLESPEGDPAGYSRIVFVDPSAPAEKPD